ncbi:MAG: hypothetical protein Pg6C_16410 [Treponemataceae bacterium]|nr:MAG: hypothetical protein Pg6C_16410 [Treponemataceae bacterium]
MHRILFAALSAAMALSFFSCSVEYDTIIDNSDDVPEFILWNASIERYESGICRVRAKAGIVEQYKQKNIYYAQDVECDVFAEDGAPQTKGAFGFAAADIDNELYTFFDSITVDNYSENTGVRAESLKWSGKSGLLASDAGSVVTITRQTEDADQTSDGAENDGNELSTAFSFTGYGFSADSNRRTYQFSDISGTIDSGDQL